MIHRSRNPELKVQVKQAIRWCRKDIPGQNRDAACGSSQEKCQGYHLICCEANRVVSCLMFNCSNPLCSEQSIPRGNLI